jgi:hypothetical protein
VASEEGMHSTVELKSAPPVEPPKSGVRSVRFAVYMAQLAVTILLTMLVRRHLLSDEMAERFKDSPYFAEIREYLAEGITLGAIAIQGFVTHTFVKISGLIAQKKLDVLGEYHRQLVQAASPNPPALVETIKETVTKEKES